MEDFNETYYATVAQVIPVFFLAILGTGIVFRKRVRRDPSLALLGIAMAGLVVVGEIEALTALSEREEPSNPGKLAILMAINLPILAVVLPMIVIYGRTVSDKLPKWARVARDLVLTIGAVAVLVASFFGDPTDVVVAVFTYGFLIAFVVSCWLGLRMDHSDLGDKDED